MTAGRLLPVLLALALLAAPIAPRADDDDDGRGLAFEELVPLEDVLARVRADFGGRVLKVEVETRRRKGAVVPVYELKILTATGNVLKLYYDARTLELLRVKGRHRDEREEEHEDD